MFGDKVPQPLQVSPRKIGQLIEANIAKEAAKELEEKEKEQQKVMAHKQKIEAKHQKTEN